MVRIYISGIWSLSYAYSGIVKSSIVDKLPLPRPYPCDRALDQAYFDQKRWRTAVQRHSRHMGNVVIAGTGIVWFLFKWEWAFHVSLGVTLTNWGQSFLKYQWSSTHITKRAMNVGWATMGSWCLYTPNDRLLYLRPTWIIAFQYSQPPNSHRRRALVPGTFSFVSLLL